MKKIILTTLVFLATAGVSFAADTAVVYTSPILILLFVGFCALIIVAQLVPAILALVGMTKEASYSRSKRAAVKS